jgi:hypothetical protein
VLVPGWLWAGVVTVLAAVIGTTTGVLAGGVARTAHSIAVDVQRTRFSGERLGSRCARVAASAR